MKRTVIAILFTIVLLMLSVPMSAEAAEITEVQDEVSDSVDELLSDYEIGYGMKDISGLSFSELFSRLKESVTARISTPLRLLGVILMISVFTAVMKSIGSELLVNGTAGSMYDMVCTVTAVTAASPMLFSVYGGIIDALDRTAGFILVFVPVFAGITAASGHAAAGGAYNFLTLAASEMTVALSKMYLIPILSVTTALAICGSVFRNSSVDGVITFIKKAVTLFITASMTLFVGFVTLKTSLAGKADGVASKTAKYMISGFVPIIGGAVSDAYSTVRGSLELIGSTAGAAGIIAVAVLLLPPLIEVFVYRVIMWAGIAVSELLSAEPLVKLLKGFDSGLAVAQSVLIGYGVMLIFSAAILLQSLS